MKKRNNNTNIASKRSLTVLLLVLFALVLTACETKNTYQAYDFFLENDRGTFTYCELVMPDTERPCPLVFMAHGFGGTRNSGGAEELSKRLAENGIAAVRIDFNSYLSPQRTSSQTDQYSLSNMTADSVIAIDYVLENYPVDTERIGIHGRSMGGRVAMIMGNESKGGYNYKAMSLVAPAGNASAMIYYMGGAENWETMKAKARTEGYCEKQGLQLTYQWFKDFEAYNPAEHGSRFGKKSVLVFYNTLDRVVLPETSLECAAGYENAEVVEVTTEDGHGYEMGLAVSPLKEEIMNRIVSFFVKAL